MKKQVLTIGGERLGSGKKMKTAITQYNRSTHNLSGKRATSMAPGVLYPIRTIQAMRGDSFDINLEADIRTLPTKGALFGSYKLQVDVFQCPIRLYQGILHNNPLAIGLKMNEVKLPIMNLKDGYVRGYNNNGDGQCNNTSLLKYLGLSGIGKRISTGDMPGGTAERKINAVPALAYYDIYKNYYANKQEEVGYFINGNTTQDEIMSNISNIEMFYFRNWIGGKNDKVKVNLNQITTYDLNASEIIVKITGENIHKYIYLNLVDVAEGTLEELESQGYIRDLNISNDANECNFKLNITQIQIELAGGDPSIQIQNGEGYVTYNLELTEFNLNNIDKMRYALLSNNELGTTYDIASLNLAPYKDLVTYEETNRKAKFHYPMQGLVVKTYQNDMYNNWLNIDWLEGENSISEMTNVAVTEGKFSMDALNFAQKLYNMLNRIVLAGNTYEDWQDVVYEEVKRRQIESPIFCGGMSKEIIFDEILQTSPTEEQPLGTIGGRGRFAEKSKKGGKIHIKCDEASYIMIIASLTPRVYYTQGNEFYLTDIFSIDDLHKPALDGIGFQDLIGERLLWKDSILSQVDGVWKVTRSKVGKLPAWIEYMTETDKAFGDFAEDEGRGYMILNRNYSGVADIEDATTYVDPSKYNYAFADASLTAQNFWLEVGIGCIARRLMSARIIPNV